MCGIAVVFDRGEKWQNIERRHTIASNMMTAQLYRGVDYRSVINYQTCTVAFNRLAITEQNKQHPSDMDWVVYLNGEIYNYQSLGYSGSEVEVIAKGLKSEGMAFISKLNGIFAIVAIHDEQVYVIRDRYGCKPIYYWDNGNYIIIASQIKAILTHPEYDFSVNESARRQWLTFNNVLTDETLFTGIYKLNKGTIWHLNTDEETKFWTWQFNPTNIEPVDAAQTVQHLVRQAVNRQTPREVKAGIFASGGVDSSIIRYYLPQLPTYTACFPGYDIDETESAKLMDSGKGNYMAFSKVECLKETINALEDLRVGASWSNYKLYQVAASQGKKVIMDGAGADELFGGYSWRYAADDYYDVVNRTKRADEYCEKLYAEKFPDDSLDARYRFDAEHFLEGVLLVGDKLSMANTIEVRVPFLDNDLVDFALTLPNHLKENKLILKQAFKGLVPDEILKAKKRGFSSPDWFEGTGNQANKWANAAFNQWTEIYASKS
jgi:asparagine synthase (glutamine-hydrolysing)